MWSVFVKAVAMFVCSLVPTTTWTGEYVLIRYRSLVPMPLHFGLVETVAWCMGTDNRPKISWGVADQIIDTTTGEQAYGLTAFLDGGGVLIVVESGHWLDNRVLSHEAIHALGGESLGERNGNPAWRCEIVHESNLGVRPPLSPDSLNTLIRNLSGNPDSKQIGPTSPNR